MSTNSIENNEYASITCTQMEPSVQLLCKCKRNNQSKDLDKIRCNEKNCIKRMDSSEYNGNAEEYEWKPSKETRYPDGTVKLRNPNIELMDQDILYHLALGSGSHDLIEMFGDVKFVCMGGPPKRMETFAHFIMGEIGYKLPTGTQLSDISAFSYRYSMYKVGPVLCVSHGMGGPSLCILLNEMIKLMYHAKCKDPIFIRIGTCGGIGVEGGTVIITEDVFDGLFRNTFELPILGKLVQRPAKLDKKLACELKSLCDPANDSFDTVIGKTMCADDFYEGQGRLDGAFCDYTENDKMEFLAKLHDFGVINIEMECTIFAALTYHAGIRSAIVCVAQIDRLKGDEVNTPKEVMLEWQKRPQMLVSRLIRKHLALDNTLEKPLIANS